MTERAARTRRTGPLAWLLIQPIRFYQRFISRYTPPSCRYYPCCSSYAIGALRIHGAAKGLLLTAWRLLRCNPWSSGGIDHVPERGRWRGRRDVQADDDPVNVSPETPTGARRYAAVGATGGSPLGGPPVGSADGDRIQPSCPPLTGSTAA